MSGVVHANLARSVVTSASGFVCKERMALNALFFGMNRTSALRVST